ncbi:DoxX family membrane protein [Gordonia sp. (in: high G+C Gram-positive bacteria)]|uniref:DoxX family membrane protein n=1 Tax=Gordonia sp. (in: high G+C Gram-positive bacteria) TaxID=84139 RepID=UPI0039E4C081
MLALVHLLDRVYLRVTGAVPFHLLVWPTRILLAIAFLPSGATKVMRAPFTELPPSDPIGGFFDHLEAMPPVYVLAGVAQLAAAALLVLPWTALLGALVYFPVIVGIVVITWSLPFGNTRYITAAMLLGTVFLLCWDWPRIRYILVPRANLPTPPDNDSGSR